MSTDVPAHDPEDSIVATTPGGSLEDADLPSSMRRRETRRRMVPVAILAGGMAVAVAVAVVGGAASRDTAWLIALAMSGAAAAVLLVMLVTRGRRRRLIGSQVAAVALSSVAATTVGVVVGARAMFISAHDLTALGVITATAAGAGLAVAWRFGTRIDDDVVALTELSRQLSRGERPPQPRLAVTELDDLGRDLRSMADGLAQAHARELTLERSRRELVAWVSHDLRSPLAGIRAMAEAMEDGVVEDPDQVRRYLRSIGEETERLTQLVDDLFELSRVTSGVLRLHAEPVRVDRLIDACARGAQPAALAEGLELRLPGTSELAAVPVVYASEVETARVLRNLLDNAIRHTPSGGTVSVQTDVGASEVAISVIDECGGIPAGDLERVFDVAFRGDAARRRDVAGGGLGLAIAKGLTEAQHGSIAVSNHHGGCCFTVELPVHPPPRGA